MKTYADLNINHFYLVIENEGENIVLVQPILETAECILLEHHDDFETTYWRKKSDEIFEVVEELTDEQVAAYEDLFEDEEEEVFEEFYEADEEEDEAID
jgi:hypothetical protein